MKVFELFDEVGTGITVDGVRQFLNANKNEEIQFDISTLGGDLGDGITIYNLIKQHPKKTIANIVGLTASAGTVIALGCDEVQMSDNSLFLIHNGWMEVTGNTYDLQNAAAQLQKTDAIMVKIYREKCGKSDAEIINLMKASDWMSPHEALELGFVDRIVSSGIKIAASALLNAAQGKINNLLLTKLQDKMKIFGKDKAENKPTFILALKDGKNLLASAEAPAAGVEVAPVGAMTLEDGSYELADGRKITVAGGVITEVTEPAQAEGALNADAIATVAAMLTASEAKIEAMIEAKLKPLAAAVSTHAPKKGAGPVNTPDASATDQLQEKIEAKMAEIKAAADKKRKGV